MRAWKIERPEGPKGLVLGEAPEVQLGRSDLRIRVVASAMNRSDLLQSLGFYPAPPGVPADIPGLEYAGEVIEVGSEVRLFGKGARVMGLVGGGAWSEEIVVHEREAARIPEGMSYADAAAIPEVFLTAYDALLTQGGLRLGDSALIHAAGSGVGSAAVQLCAAFGATAIGTTRSEKKVAAITELGASSVIVVQGSPPLFADAVRRATNGRGVNLVLELIGGTYFPESIASLAHQGKIVLLGLLEGRRAEIDLSVVLRERITVLGSTMRLRPLEGKIALARILDEVLAPLFLERVLRPIVSSCTPMDDLPRALESFAQGDHVGKRVLMW